MFRFLLFACLISISLHVFADSFTWTGGSLEGGSVLCVTQDPVVPKVLYAGTWAGLYRSTDAGSEWSPVELPFPGSVFSLAWDSQQSRLFAGGAGRIFVIDRIGFVWSTLDLPAAETPVSAILFDADSPMLVYAGTAGQGLFRGDDGGQTWTALGPLATDGQPWKRNITDLARDPASGTVYVATQGGLFKATTTGLKQIDTANTSALVSRSEDSRVFAASGNLLRSGSVESTLWGPRFVWREKVQAGAISNSILDLCLDPHDPSMLWAGTDSGIYRGQLRVDSSTYKETVVWKKTGPVNTAIGSIFCAGGTDGTVFAGGTSGFWTTADGGETWRNSNSGIHATRFLDVVPVPGNPGMIFATVPDSLLYNYQPSVRVFRSDDWATTWRLVLEAPFGGVRPSLAIDPGRSDSFGTDPFALYLEGKRRSTDLGETWTIFIPFASSGSVTSFYIDPGKPDNQAVSIFYGGPFGVHTFIRVTNDGWRSSSQIGGSSRLLRTDPHSPHSVYLWGIAHWDGSTNEPRLVIPLAAEDLEPDRFVPGRLYVVSNGRLYVYPGASNQAELAGLPPEVRVLTVRCHLTQPGVVAVGTSEGLYLSHDYGASWEKVTARGLNTGQVFGVSFDPEDASVVYLAAARGAFRLRFVSNIERRRRPRAFDGGVE